MIVDDFYICGTGRSPRPRKADQPLVVDADRELSGTIAFQSFQPVARQSAKIGKARCRVHPVKPDFGLPRETGKLFDVFSGSETLGSLIAIADDHR